MACSALNCSNRPSRNPTLQFFRFPLRDAERLKLWLINMRRKDWTPSIYSRLCCEHFEEDQFLISIQGKRRLNDSAVPTNFPSDVKKKVPARVLRKSLVSILKVSDQSVSSCSSPSQSLQPLTSGHSSSTASNEHNYVNAPLEVVIKEETDNWCQNDTVETDYNPIKINECFDHDYCINPKTLKRKINTLQDQLCVARKKLKLKSQEVRRLNSKLSSLKHIISLGGQGCSPLSLRQSLSHAGCSCHQ